MTLHPTQKNSSENQSIVEVQDAAPSTVTAASIPTSNQADDQELGALKDRIHWYQELLRSGKQPILFLPPLSQESTNLLDSGLQTIDTLGKKILAIKNEILLQHHEIRSRVEAIDRTEKVRLSINVQRAEDSVEQYTALLDSLLIEIKAEINALNEYRGLKEQTMVIAQLHEPSEFNALIAHKVGLVKKQIKRIDRDLDVSFSRYQFSFHNHRKQLANVEAVLAYNGHPEMGRQAH